MNQNIDERHLDAPIFSPNKLGIWTSAGLASNVFN